MAVALAVAALPLMTLLLMALTRVEHLLEPPTERTPPGEEPVPAGAG